MLDLSAEEVFVHFEVKFDRLLHEANQEYSLWRREYDASMVTLKLGPKRPN